MAKKQKKIVYAKNCIYAGELVYELIHKCSITKIGCHSQENCEHYKEKKMRR